MATASRAVVAALAASFQPANAATRTGERSSGGSEIHFSASTQPNVAPYLGTVRRFDRGARRAKRRRAAVEAPCFVRFCEQDRVNGGSGRQDPPGGRRAAAGPALRGTLRMPAEGT